jgi:CysZ protein
MRSIIRSFPLAFEMIVTDPVNLVLGLIPTLIALTLYLLSVVSIYRNSDLLHHLVRGYISSPQEATILAKILTAILIIFVFFIMNWTFILVVGIISGPFNSLLSLRIEEKLSMNKNMDEDQKHALREVKRSMLQTFKNELKKIFFLIVAGSFAFILNLFPLFYPLAAVLVAVLFAVQFVDYSWSRHDLSVATCLKDVFKNIIPYSLSGLIFLALLAVPLLNTFVPALATSYFTVLWLDRQNMIQQTF